MNESHNQPLVQPGKGVRRIDLIVPMAALFVSFVSIILTWRSVAVEERMAGQNERLVQASSLPHLSEHMTTFTGADGLDRVTMGVENDGVGPAEIRSAEISIAGKSVPDAEELLKRFDIPGGPLALASLTNVMLRSGQRLDYFDLRANSSIARQVNNMVSAVQQHEIVVSLCYCSVFNVCWIVGSPNARPRPVQQCPAVRTPYE